MYNLSSLFISLLYIDLYHIRCAFERYDWLQTPKTEWLNVLVLTEDTVLMFRMLFRFGSLLFFPERVFHRNHPYHTWSFIGHVVLERTWRVQLYASIWLKIWLWEQSYEKHGATPLLLSSCREIPNIIFDMIWYDMISLIWYFQIFVFNIIIYIYVIIFDI